MSLCLYCTLLGIPSPLSVASVDCNESINYKKNLISVNTITFILHSPNHHHYLFSSLRLCSHLTHLLPPEISSIHLIGVVLAASSWISAQLHSDE
ncbi:hypothetical protein GDO78_000042 [Eleutherodactylus coqui]|uniref:Secreted protein n=1 Tax=Eleutherodactylus coqui TaxID=57060 RepID=A0A8J6KK10_ELECQ|nr:hypothetical protein GDO78_000042 [Eleutherodactylus coqui]